MATAAQIAANRANAQKSTGPRTEAGKAASARNALKHGLCAERFLLEEEEREAWEALRADYLARLRPEGPAETRLAERIAQLAWRRDRTGAAEAAAWAGVSRDGWSDAKGGGEISYVEPGADPLILGMAAAIRNGVLKELARLTLYEARITRELARLSAELSEMQRVRRARAVAAAMAAEEAAAKAQASKPAAPQQQPRAAVPPAAPARPEGESPAAPTATPAPTLADFRARQSELEAWAAREKARLAAAERAFAASRAAPDRPGPAAA